MELQSIKNRKSKQKLEAKKFESSESDKRHPNEKEQLLNFVEKLRKSKKEPKLKPRKVFGTLYAILGVRNIYLSEVFT